MILLYHRVAEAEVDPFRLCVSPERFEQQVRRLATRYPVTTLEALLASRNGRTEPEKHIIVTFDDGYADNLELAQPIAAELGLPFTVFVAAGPVLSGELFWWDQLTASVLAVGAAASPFTVDVSGRTYSFVADSDEARRRSLTNLHRLLRRLTERNRREVLEQIANQRGSAPKPAVGRPLTPEELHFLASLPGVTIGAHTVNHPVLTSLPSAEQFREVEDGRRLLEARLGRAVNLFSYPYGRGSDVRAQTRQVVAKAGYRAACTTVQGAVSPRTSRYALSRLTVYDWHADDLLVRVKRLLGD